MKRKILAALFLAFVLGSVNPEVIAEGYYRVKESEQSGFKSVIYYFDRDDYATNLFIALLNEYNARLSSLSSDPSGYPLTLIYGDNRATAIVFISNYDNEYGKYTVVRVNTRLGLSAECVIGR